MSISDWNGFQLCGKILPDIALENVLASVPVDELLKLRKVSIEFFINEICVFVIFSVMFPGMSSVARYNVASYFLENCS